MVVSDNFQDIFDASSKVPVLSLPAIKQNPLKIEYESGTTDELVYDGPEPPLPFISGEVFLATIAESRRLTAKDPDCKAVYEVTFDISGSNFSFKPGDTIGIVPGNKTSEVDFIISHLELQAKANVSYTLTADQSIKSCKVPPFVPIKSSLRHVLTHCLEIRSVLKKLFILALSQHTKDENERKVLEYLCSKEGSNTYTTHVLNSKLCLIDLFTIFKSCKPPIEVLISNLPRLLPRPYSIVNSSLKDPNVLKICFSVVNVTHNRKGLTTAWLEETILNDLSLESAMKELSVDPKEDRQKVPIYLRKNMSGFRIPDDLATPLVMIGPGTGVAPFIGFLEERETMNLMDPALKLGEAWLVFGCRNPELDFIYKKELARFKSKGMLDRLLTAFSRVESAEFKYVQDAVLKEGKEITRLIESGAAIFICGDLNTLAAQIRETFVKCLIEHSGRSKVEAESLVLRLQKENRYFIDAWS